MTDSQLSRRDVLKTLGLGAAPLVMPALEANSAASGKKPNVLFIAVDDLRPQLSCYGHKHTISPNLDRLATEGTLFERCYCQVPVCGASRASLLSGVRPTRQRYLSYSTKVDTDLPGVLTLPMHFRNNGYHTLSNGKIYHHLNDNAKGWSEKPWRPSLRPGGSWRNYLLEENKKKDTKTQRGPAYENADVPDSAYYDGRMTEKTIDDMRRLSKGDQPFFLAAGFMKPHLPFNAPKRYWDKYKRDEIDLADNPFRPKGAPDAAFHNWGELRAYSGIPPKGPLPDELARTLIHGYYACVSYTDALVGRLLDELGRLGLRENTIVILWGDHGWNLGEHGLWCKHCNFETSLHSPLFVSAPGFQKGTRTRALSEFVDIYPSLCELCDLPRPGHLQGTSFVPLMKEPERAWKKAAFSRYFNGDSIRTDRFRYTEWKRKNGDTYAQMLYDHQTDPAENINIVELPENQPLVERFSKMLAQGWRAVRK